jgi:hypothetical protein
MKKYYHTSPSFATSEYASGQPEDAAGTKSQMAQQDEPAARFVQRVI